MDSKKTFFYKPELDVIRFIAFFAVFLHHVFPNTPELYAAHFPEFYAHLFASMADSLRLGLSIFFFLSAYLIATLLMIERENYGHIDLKLFYVRRILRIWPLYFTGLLVGVSFAFWHYPAQLSMFKYYAFFVSNLYFLSHPFTGSLMGHLWNISVEEQFYVTFPLMVFLLRRSFFLPLGILFIVVSLVALAVQGSGHLLDDLTIWTNTLCQFIFFGTGVLCAIFTRNHNVNPFLPLRILFFLLSCFLFFATSHFLLEPRPTTAATTLLGYILVAIACALLLFSFLNAKIKFPDFIVYLGKISYGLYVWHRVGIFVVGHFISHNVLVELLAIFPTIAISMVSYRFLELPFLKLKNKFTHIKNRPV